MFMRMIYDEKLAQAAYLIGCQRTGEAIVIDPERDIDRYINLARAEGLSITAVAETHIHADFLSGARELAERIGARLYLSDEGDADWKYQWLDQKSGGGTYDHRLLKDGDTFAVGNIQFSVVHTPGHTPEHISFLVTDRGGGADEPMAIATGDFVFVGDLGRPDLLESAAGFKGAKEPAARRLFSTLQKFLALPDFIQVWPAHGAGSACGKALGAVPQTTVGYERRFNPAIQAAESEGQFVDFILSGQPEPPIYFARMKRDNKLGPKLLGSLPQPAALSTEQIIQLGQESGGLAIVDTRPWKVFRDAHLPGAIFAPLDSTFHMVVGSYIDENTPIFLVAEADQVETLVRNLVRIGLDDIRGSITPQVLVSARASGAHLTASPELSAADLRRLMDKTPPFILDVRRADEFAEGHILNAHHIPYTRLAERLNELPRDQRIVVNCRSGARSARACAFLQHKGFDCINLAGGYLAWETSHQPTVTA
jgi:hydroxyacylglutathione hydrolase